MVNFLLKLLFLTLLERSFKKLTKVNHTIGVLGRPRLSVVFLQAYGCSFLSFLVAQIAFASEVVAKSALLGQN